MQGATKVITILIWAVLLVLPILFFFADVGAVLPQGPLTSLYWSTVQLFGEPVVRLAFCGIWLSLEIAFFWRLVISKRPVDFSDVDGLAD